MWYLRIWFLNTDQKDNPLHSDYKEKKCHFRALVTEKFEVTFYKTKLSQFSVFVALHGIVKSYIFIQLSE